ncbi:hypothetical protein [Millisia brevis]|uniref:hypothetical protein n=1 Tax=Millisia brevis TaxID=264148 RepID=UPI00082AD78F|nr:hypothetical protein [Millisia brevis]
MEIIDLDSWRPEPGMGIGWRVTPDPRSVDATATERGASTFLVDNHVRAALAARREGKPHRAYLGSGTDIDGDLDIDAMTAALLTFVRRHAILRTWYDVVDGEVVARVMPARTVGLESVDPTALSSSAEIIDHIRTRFGRETSSDSFPGLAFGAVMREGSFSFFFGADHGLSDGASQVFAVAEISRLYREARGAGVTTAAGSADATDRDTPATEGTCEGFAEFARLEAELTAHHVAGSAEFDAWKRTFVRHDRRMPRFALDLGLGVGETAPVRPVGVVLLDGDRIADFERICVEAGGRLITGLYAALAITDYELAGSDSYYGMTVFNSRVGLESLAGEYGWFSSFAPVEFAVSGVRTFRELVPDAYVASRRARKLAVVPPGAALAALIAVGASPDSVITAPNLFSYIDFRKIPDVDEPACRRGVVFTGEGRTANASLWFNRDHDRLYVGSQSPDTPFAQSRVLRYLEHLRAVITEVTTVGDRAIGAERSDIASAGRVAVER